ncbi:unnamed protein product [Heligmosomoides polygyrus]|uniref:Uncharacterized protein n=1 Tax=Heligmosomoides polygyrus TaxID=6339 RepID=A0A183FE61_HELPZ|nr:unnamed protein product [Heligmosomoides polygyrus]
MTVDFIVIVSQGRYDALLQMGIVVVPTESRKCDCGPPSPSRARQPAKFVANGTAEARLAGIFTRPGKRRRNAGSNEDEDEDEDGEGCKERRGGGFFVVVSLKDGRRLIAMFESSSSPSSDNDGKC